MAPEEVLERIRQLAQHETLFRIHLTYHGFYARARRQFGSWQGAVLAAGVSYQEIVVRARSRSLNTRSQRRRRV